MVSPCRERLWYRYIYIYIDINQQFSIINYKIGVKYTEQDTVSLLRSPYVLFNKLVIVTTNDIRQVTRHLKTSPVNSIRARGNINSSEADYIKIHIKKNSYIFNIQLILRYICLKGEFAVVLTAKICGRSLS